MYKKNYRLFVILVVGSLFSAFAGVLSGAWNGIFANMQAVSVAHAAPAPALPCYDISGSGAQVLVNGVANSGVVQFDAPYEPDKQYAACAEDEGNNIMYLKGWVWNDNLGWISLFCDKDGLNRGATCGDNDNQFPYGVTIDKNGYLGGYAWGDNVGWISFDNGIHSQVRVEENGVCKGDIYGFQSPAQGCAAHGGDADGGKQWTYAWSDNVGWIDFAGVKIPLENIQQTVSKVSVSFLKKSEADGGEQVVDPSTLKKFRWQQANVPQGSIYPPVANGTDNYKLRVTVLDSQSQPLDSNRYKVEITPIWFKDTVKMNQTVSGTYNNAGPGCSRDPITVGAVKGAVTKPCASADFSSTPDGDGNYDSIPIKSIAPTSNMNGQSDENGNVNFSYETTILPSTIANQTLQPNDLELMFVDVKVIDTQSNTPIYPDASGNPQHVFPAYAGNDHGLRFLPATEVTKLNSPDLNNPDAINLMPGDVGTVKDFEVLIAGPGQVDFHSDIEPPLDATLKFVFKYNADPDNLNWEDDSQAYTPDDNNIGQLGAGFMQDPNVLDPVQIVSGLSMHSTVTDSTGATYYSNKLPRVTAPSGIDPVAVFRGNIYSSGDYTNAVRDTIYKNVKKLIGNQEPTTPGSVGFYSSGTGGGFTQFSGLGTARELLPLNNKGSKVYYVHGNVYLSNFKGPDINWDNERTIIAIGGSIYVNADLVNPANGGNTSSVRPKLGLIALKDTAANGGAVSAAMQGNIYIAPTVKIMQGVNIVASGSVFSYNGDMTSIDQATGRPVFGTGPASADQVLKGRQLLCQCTILSHNKTGGASSPHDGGNDPYILGDGTTLTVAQDPNAQEIARLYDFNYLRRYTGVLRSDGAGGFLNAGTPPKPVNGNNIKKSADNTPWSVYDTPQGGALFPPDDPLVGGNNGYFAPAGLNKQTDLAAFYVFFDPPTPTQPGFAGIVNQSRKQGGV